MSLPINQIILGEAIASMRQLPDASIDALISDPPYGVTEIAWDKKIDWEAFWVEAKRVCKPNAIMALFAQQPFATDLIVSNRKNFRYEIVWEKPMATGFLDANRRPMRCHELILVFCAKPGSSIYNPQKTPGEAYQRDHGEDDRCQHYGRTTRIDTSNTGDRFPRDVLKFKSVSKGSFFEGKPGVDPDAFHPTQKPLDLIKWLVSTYSNPDAVILDPFMGAGTTAVACIETGRNFIGSELNPEYHAISLQRIATFAAKALRAA